MNYLFTEGNLLITFSLKVIFCLLIWQISQEGEEENQGAFVYCPKVAGLVGTNETLISEFWTLMFCTLESPCHRNLQISKAFTSPWPPSVSSPLHTHTLSLPQTHTSSVNAFSPAPINARPTPQRSIWTKILAPDPENSPRAPPLRRPSSQVSRRAWWTAD